MPWTPMAVRAWRTSSSLNGLMIATTSFMVRPSFLERVFFWQVRLAGKRLRCPSKSGIFLGRWHKKVEGLRGKHSEQVTSLTVQGGGSSDTMGFIASHLADFNPPPLPHGPHCQT